MRIVNKSVGLTILALLIFVLFTVDSYAEEFAAEEAAVGSNNEIQIVDMSEENYYEQFEARSIQLKECWGKLLEEKRLILQDDNTVVITDASDIANENHFYVSMMLNALNDSIELGLIHVSTQEGRLIIDNTEIAKDIENQLGELYSKNISADVTANISSPSLEQENHSQAYLTGASAIHKCEYEVVDWLGICQRNYNQLVNYYESIASIYVPARDSSADPYSTTVAWWVLKVREHGEWDYKRNDFGPWNKIWCSYYNGNYNHITAEYMGNYNYGYTGSFLFSRDILYAGSYAAAKFNSKDIADWPAIDDGRNEALRREGNNIRDKAYSIEWSETTATMYRGEQSRWSVFTSPYDATVAWSSTNEAVARVDQSGVVTAVSAGGATIKASANGKTIQMNVTVKEPTLSWTETKDSYYVGESSYWSFSSKPYSSGTWKSSNANIAVVSADGKVTAKGAGSAQVSVSANGITISKTITIKETQLKASATQISLAQGEMYQWAVEAVPKVSLSYKTSNTSVAIVDNSGKITAGSKVGEAVITASGNGKTVSIKVIVEAPSITWKKYEATLYVGGKSTFAVNTKPSLQIQWSSSEPSIATVDANGVVTAKKKGTTTIVATHKALDLSIRQKVTVKDPILKWNITKPAIYTGEQVSWSIQKTPSSAAIKWTSSNAKVATVSDGKIKGITPGKATISASSAGAKITKEITIKKRTLSWKTTHTSIYKGQSVTWSVNKEPSNAKIIWSSSNTKVATVANGVIKGVGVGKATITGNNGGVKVTKSITVKAPTLTWGTTATSIYRGQKTTWTVNRAPASGSVNWSSSNSNVASVSGGTITAKKAGSATIYAKANGLTISKKITVKEPNVTWKSYTKDIKAKQTYQFSVTTTPSTAVTWSSTNPAVATISKSGLVTAKKAGTTTIKASAHGKTITKSLNVVSNSSGGRLTV